MCSDPPLAWAVSTLSMGGVSAFGDVAGRCRYEMALSLKPVPYHSHSLSCGQPSLPDSPRGDSAMQMPESHPAPSAPPTNPSCVSIPPASWRFRPLFSKHTSDSGAPRRPGPGMDSYHSAALMAGLTCAERAWGWEPNRPGQGCGGPSSPFVRRGEGNKIWRSLYPDCPEARGETCLLRLPLSTWNSPLSRDTQPTM